MTTNFEDVKLPPITIGGILLTEDEAITLHTAIGYITSMNLARGRPGTDGVALEAEWKKAGNILLLLGRSELYIKERTAC